MPGERGYCLPAVHLKRPTLGGLSNSAGRVIAVAMVVLVTACSGGNERAATTTVPIVRVRGASPAEFATALCTASGGSEPAAAPVVTFADLDTDGAEEAIVSAACRSEPARTVNGVFIDGEGQPRLAGHFRGDDLIVLRGSGTRLAVVVPVTTETGDDAGLVERVVYVLANGSVRVAEERQMTVSEYLASFAPPEKRRTHSDLIEEWKTGVALIEPVACTGSGRHGSGFLVAPNLVVTNAHVVEEAVLLRIEVGGDVTDGVVLGEDQVRDLALVELARSSNGHLFTLAESEPRIGLKVSALGFPLGRLFSATPGDVSGTGRRFQLEGSFFEDAIQTSAPINGGNSGGPLVDETGAVQGVNAAGARGADNVAYAIPAAHVAELVARWRGTRATNPAVPPECGTGNGVIESSVVHRDLPPILDSLTAYVTGINDEEYRQAWDLTSASQRGDEAAFQRFQEGVSTSILSEFRIAGLEREAQRSVAVSVAFRSTQDAAHGRNGQTCTDWQMRYVMSPHDDGVWRIDSSNPLADPVACEVGPGG